MTMLLMSRQSCLKSYRITFCLRQLCKFCIQKKNERAMMMMPKKEGKKETLLMHKADHDHHTL